MSTRMEDGMVTIRGAELADAERLLEIYDHYVRTTAVSFEYETPSLDEFRSRMERTLSRYPYLVAEVDGLVAGYAYAGAFHARAAYSWCAETTIYLDHEMRGQGIGRALLTALEGELEKMGVLNLYACVACPHEEEDEYLSSASADFHARMGYTQVGEFHGCGYKFDRFYDMVWMEKLIGKRTVPQPPVRPYPTVR